jgi:methylenetetrahydrofolate dehydrogenase (NAD+)
MLTQCHVVRRTASKYTLNALRHCTTQAHEPGFVVNATDIAQPFRQQTKQRIIDEYGGLGPRVIGFLSNDDPSALQYGRFTQKTLRRDGINFELERCKDIELEQRVCEANNDANVHGIMVFYPVFGSRPSFYGDCMDDYIRDCISIEKDVEGMSHTYRHWLYRNRRYVDTPTNEKKCILPCTPLGILRVLEYLKVYDEELPAGKRMLGKTVTVINRSEVVGR